MSEPPAEEDPHVAALMQDPQLREALILNAQINEHRTRMEMLGKHRDFMREAMNASVGLNQIIVALGYAAFLAVWSEMADKLNRDIVVLTGGFLISSLTVFIAYMVANIAVLSATSLDYGSTMARAHRLSPDEQALALDGVATRQGAKMAPLLMLWPFLFGFQVISGLLGAIILGATAFGDILGRLAH